MKPIQTTYYPKQCKEYYAAVKSKDWYAANLLYLPPIHRRLEDIESEIKFNQLIADFEAENKRIASMTEQQLRTELAIKYPSLNQKPKKSKGFLSWLFS